MRTALIAVVLGASACSRGGEPERERASEREERDPQDVSRPEIRDAFVEAQRRPRHASDGGGRARLVLGEGQDGSVVAGTSGRWTIEYTAGPLGIAEGGAIYLQVSPFFEWSTPQAADEAAPGFTRVSTTAEGVELAARTLDQQLLGVEVGGRALREGELVTIVYGAGPAGARADPYAEKASRLWIAVDGDGDGARKVLRDSPGVDVLPGPPAMLVATLPSTARAGEPVRLCLALLDARANLAGPCEARIELADLPGGLELPREIELVPSDRGRKSVTGVAREEGVLRLRAVAKLDGRELEATTNPLLVSGGPRILWGDLHGHSALSDGTGSPEDFHEYARDVAALDVVALTDHDHWGLLFLDEDPDLWRRNVEAARAFEEPGRFVALPGYEWTSWLTGHRHVLFFGDETPLCSSIDERYDTPGELREALRGKEALIVPHHPAGGPIAIDWRVAPDPELEPVVELCSAHGTSEALDAPRVLHSPRPGHFARDALERGYRFGFVASGDGHDGHPGLAWKGPHYPTGGLVALLSEDLTRAGVLRALKERRCYATSGPRILLRFAVGSARMGETVSAASVAEEARLYVHVIAASQLESVELVLRGGEILSFPCQGELEFAAGAALGDLEAGDWVYLRATQLDGGLAWSSPVFVE
jgi:hypothetical protein